MNRHLAVTPTIATVPVPGRNGAHDSEPLLEMARAEVEGVLKKLGSQVGGLSEGEPEARLKQIGPNEIARPGDIIRLAAGGMVPADARVAVTLTPEMLPMIVTVNLSKGAMAIRRFGE